MKVVEAADVVIEVLDARDPLSCRCLDVERLVRRSGADKKVILLLNKIGKHRQMLLLSSLPLSSLHQVTAGRQIWVKHPGCQISVSRDCRACPCLWLVLITVILHCPSKR